MSSDAPAIPLFGDAYLADTRHLSLEEHGAYLQLMMIAWRSPGCALPNDDTRLARMLGITPGKWSKIKAAVMDFWTLSEAGWTQKRLSKERSYVEKKRENNSRAAKSRWIAQDTENIEGEECERTSECNAPPPPPNYVEESKASSTKRARQKQDRNQGFEIPDWVPPERWQAYLDMRRTIRKPMTDHAKRLAINQLGKLRDAGYPAGDVLDQSVLNSWQGLFALKDANRAGRDYRPPPQQQDFSKIAGNYD